MITAHAERRGDQRSDRQRDQDRPPGPARREPGRVGRSVLSRRSRRARHGAHVPARAGWPRSCRSTQESALPMSRHRATAPDRHLDAVAVDGPVPSMSGRTSSSPRTIKRIPMPKPDAHSFGLLATVGDLGRQFASEFSPLPEIGTADPGTSERVGQIAGRSIASTPNDAVRGRPNRSEFLDSIAPRGTGCLSTLSFLITPTSCSCTPARRREGYNVPTERFARSARRGSARRRSGA